jgi:thiamine pyrophosphokinase
MSRSALVFCGGDAPSETTLANLQPPDLVVGADSGIDHAIAAGYLVDIAVGDFDSVSVAGLQKAKDQSAVISQHQPNKDETDFELALQHAVDAGVGHITVVGIDGGRLDHQLGNIMALANPRFGGVVVKAVTDSETITVVHSSVLLEGHVGGLVSLIPVGGDVLGIETEGLSYPLRGETLSATSSRGISNTFSAPVATVRIASGVLLAIETAE